MDFSFARELGLDFIPLSKPLDYSQPVNLAFPGNHTLSFDIFESTQHPLILGFLWLKQHNLHRDLVF